MIGKTLGGKYRIERVLGEGGMGSVYAAEDTTTGARVAVKVIHGSLPANAASLVQRFEREARAAGSIATDHICRCLDAGSDPESGAPYMVLEYLVGEDVQHLLNRLGPVPPELGLRIVAQALIGLSAAHQAGVVHRDIKPANIFLTKAEGGEHVVKLLDFGVAKIKRDPSDLQSDTAGLTRTGSILGSPLYMSPEQARSTKSVDHRSDLWSLGVVLYQLVSGRTPYQHISGLGDLIIALCSDLPPPVQQFAPWVAPEVAAVIDRALRVEVRERYQTAAEMLDAVRALLPDGTAIRDDMMVPLDDATHDYIAPTYFRKLGLATPAVATAQTMAQPVSPSTPPPTPAPVSAPPPAATGVGATTGPGVGTTQSVSRAPAGRPIPVVPLAIACMLVGGLAAYGLTRPGPAPAAPIPVATAPALPTVSAMPATTAPTVTPQATATAAPTAAETATPAPSDSASAKPAAPAAASASASAPKPKTSAGPKGTPLDHRAYGDRK